MSLASELVVGGLWRDVVNFAGPSPAPAVFIPLLDAIAPKWSRWTHFMGMMADVLRTPEHRLDIEEEVRWAVMGFRLWTEHRDAIQAWARASSREPISDEEIENWWLGGERRCLTVEEQTHLRVFLKRVPFTSIERRLIDARVASEGRPLLIYRIREHLGGCPQFC